MRFFWLIRCPNRQKLFFCQKKTMNQHTVKIRVRPGGRRGRRRPRVVNFAALDRACEAFWKKRGMKAPHASHVGIDQSTTAN